MGIKRQKQQLEWGAMEETDGHERCMVFRIHVEHQEADVAFDRNDVARAADTSSDACTNSDIIVPPSAPKSTTTATSSAITTTALCSKPISARHDQPHAIVTPLHSQGNSASSGRNSNAAEMLALPLGPIASDDSRASLLQQWWSDVEQNLDTLFGAAEVAYYNKQTPKRRLLAQKFWYDYNCYPNCRNLQAHFWVLGVTDGNDRRVHQYMSKMRTFSWDLTILTISLHNLEGCSMRFAQCL